MQKKILVIEDNPVIVQLLETLLKEHQFEVVSAGDGQEGLQRIESDKPDMIILDVMMPKMTGYQFFKELRAKGEEFKTIPVLITSAKESMKDFFDRWDIVDFLPKPFNSETLIDKIETVFKNLEISASIEQMQAETKKSSKSAGVGTCKVMVIGVEDFVVDRVKDYFEAKRWVVIKALDTKDALKTAISEKPDYVLCQFWEEKEKLDAQEVEEVLHENAQTKGIPFFIFCTSAMSLEAARKFKRGQILEYRTTEDLAAKLKQAFFHTS